LYLILPYHSTSFHSMQGTRTTDKAPISMENERNGGRMSVRRKFANMLEYFNNPFSTKLPPQEDEAAPAAKRRRLEASTAADAEQDIFFDAHTTDVLTDALTASPGDAVAVAPTDAVTPSASLPSARASCIARRSWKPEEDAKLTEAVRKLGDDWDSVAALVPGRTKVQCRKRWVDDVDEKGKWEAEEDAKLVEAVKKHGGNWVEIAALVKGRTKSQCSIRWHKSFGPTIDQTTPHRKGKWTPEEDAQLIEAVMKHGNKWVEVATLVPGRMGNQCYNRWHIKLGPTTIQTTPPNKGKWSAEEDANLIEAVEKRGNKWVAVAALVPGRTNDQCSLRWQKCLDPAIARSRGKWTAEEDAKLTEAVKRHGKKWTLVAALVPGRSNPQCLKRWNQSVDPSINKGKWTLEEDSKLIDAVTKFGSNFAAVATRVPDRTNRQCRTRWIESLDPDVRRGKWTEEEDAKLAAAAKKHGNKWVAVAPLVPGRTSNQCSERWLKMDPTTAHNKGKWTVEEGAKLTEAVSKLGYEWPAVAALVPGRTHRQCRQRWVESLDPAITRNRVKWTEEEDRKLTEAVTKLGNDWIQVALLVPSRTNLQCRKRWVCVARPNAGC
jgi:hypothetical protein